MLISTTVLWASNCLFRWDKCYN